MNSNPQAVLYILLRRVFSVFLALVLPISLVFITSGCCLPIPRPFIQSQDRTADVTCMDPIPVSLFVEEARRQLQSAYDQLPYINEKFYGDDNEKYLYPKQGSAEFVGETELILTKNGNILAMIPFMGHVGSEVSPKLGLKSTTTLKQTMTFTFTTIPLKKVDLSEKDKNDGKDKDIEKRTTLIKKNDAITKVLIATFNEIASIPDRDELCYRGTGIAKTEIKLNFAFTVKREIGGSLSIDIVPLASILKSIKGNPFLSASNMRQGMYKLELKIPFAADETSDNRRIFEGKITSLGREARINLTETSWSSDIKDDLIDQNKNTYYCGRPELRRRFIHFMSLKKQIKDLKKRMLRECLKNISNLESQIKDERRRCCKLPSKSGERKRGEECQSNISKLESQLKNEHRRCCKLKLNSESEPNGSIPELESQLECELFMFLEDWHDRHDDDLGPGCDLCESVNLKKLEEYFKGCKERLDLDSQIFNE